MCMTFRSRVKARTTVLGNYNMLLSGDFKGEGGGI